MINQGWFKANRGQNLDEFLIKKNVNAFVLLYIIAKRARYSDADHGMDLQRGECVLGDVKNYGMSQQNYRTAKKFLIKCGFITTKVTSHGTIAKIVNTGIFDPMNEQPNNQVNNHLTSTQQPPNNHLTTNKKDNKENNDKKETTTEENFVVAAVECNIPSQAEVTEYGLKNGCSQELCKRFFEYYQGNNKWLNQYGRMIDWQMKLATWRDDPKNLTNTKAGKPKESIQHLKSVEETTMNEIKTIKNELGDLQQWPSDLFSKYKDAQKRLKDIQERIRNYGTAA